MFQHDSDPPSLRTSDIVSLITSVSSVMLTDSSVLLLLLSISFLLGVLVRENTGGAVRQAVRCTNCRRPTPTRSPHHSQIKRKLNLQPDLGDKEEFYYQTTGLPFLDEKLSVREAESTYRVQDLVPPSFFVHEKTLDNSEDAQPATYQSFLVRKFNLKPPINHVMPLHSSQVIVRTENVRSDNVRESNLREADSPAGWRGSTDWVQHWIE